MNQPSSSLTLQIQLLGDWHVGEGAGQPGHIDRLVRRHPQDHLPYLPAKTITGIWRDACEAVAGGFGDGWVEWLAVVFGDQPAIREERDYGRPIREASLSVRPARFPEALRDHLAPQKNRTLREAITFIKPGIKIDRETGQAMDDFLRFEEVARGGLTLEAKVTLTGLSDADRKTALAILWAGARVVERLGGKRRRGLGRCFFTLQNAGYQDSEFLGTLSENAPKVPDPMSDAPQELAIDTAPQDKEWVRARLDLELLQPTVVPAQTVGNVVETLDFIPGTYLLGHVTRVLERLLRQDLTPEVARGDVRVTNAYVAVEGERGLPVPLALFYAKDDGGLEKGQKVWNRQVDKASQDDQLKQHRGGYVGKFVPGNLPPFTKSGELLLQTTHNTVEDLRQRPSEAVGGVYTYGSIRGGTKLRAELRLRKALADRLPQGWWEELAGEVRLGVAKKDDYGLAKLKPVAVQDPDPEEGRNQPTQTEAPGQSRKLSVWLLSDMLLRDDRLHAAPTVEQLREALNERLNPLCVTLKEPSVGRAGVDTLCTIARTRRTEGWRVAWVRQQPSRIALMAGSCFVFEVEGTLPDTATLRDLELEGLGERRGEGYGEVAFNHPLTSSSLAQLRAKAVSKRNSTCNLPPPIPGDHPLHAYARLLETAAWRAAARRTAEAIGGDTSWRREHFAWSKDKPKNSQLGSLRVAVAQLRSFGQRNPVLQWLDHLEQSEGRQERWPTQGRDTIRRLMRNQQIMWDWLIMASGADAWATMTQDAREQLKTDLWPIAVRCSIFACIRGELRDREQASRSKKEATTAERSQHG